MITSGLSKEEIIKHYHETVLDYKNPERGLKDSEKNEERIKWVKWIAKNNIEFYRKEFKSKFNTNLDDFIKNNPDEVNKILKS